MGRVEVLGITKQGMWLLVRDEELFLPQEQFPWFADARVSDVYDVRFLGKSHLHWPALDVDLALDSIRRPEAYPLIYK